MNPRLIATLLTIAKDARQWPETRHLADEALRALASEHVSTIDQILPVAIVNINDDQQAEAEPPPRAASAARRT
jgi:hypothetical protein